MESWHARNKEKLAAYKRQYYASHEEYRQKKIQKALERYYRLKAAVAVQPLPIRINDRNTLGTTSHRIHPQ